METFEKLLNKSYRFLSYRPRSEKELMDYLIKKTSFSKIKEGEERQNLESVINSIIKKLKEQKFLDDKEFAKWWIEQRSKARPKSLKFIIFELKRKGIGKDLVEEILENKDFEVISDFDKALALAQKRLARYKRQDPKKFYEKMARFLASKGFDFDIIKKVIDQISPKRYNTDRQ
ncbi:MAG: hypothetical protein A2171_01955 [Candidatus Levybacteria bacterium RBG_13_35_9]|nr:MAG: hypothetical protein A2171_01955 [Candidatus Levybacteria bacterium RBG_13_35_9]